MKKLWITLAMLGVALLSGCQTVQPYDYTNLKASKPKSILVLPPINNSVEVTAPYSFLSTISRPLAEKGYYVFPVSVIDAFMKENGLPTSFEMHSVPTAEIYKQTHADSILYVTINEWGQSYQLLASNTVVDSTAKLVDAQTGTLLWESRFHYVLASGDGGAGLVGMLVNAVVAQIAGSIIDETPRANRFANQIALNHSQTGLLPGPYVVPQ